MGMPPEHGLGGAEAALVLFVGDADQLPSVEPGKFLGDILFILDTGGCCLTRDLIVEVPHTLLTKDLSPWLQAAIRPAG